VKEVTKIDVIVIDVPSGQRCLTEEPCHRSRNLSAGWRDVGLNYVAVLNLLDEVIIFVVFRMCGNNGNRMPCLCMKDNLRCGARVLTCIMMFER
jgi:hypothetical protein